MPSSSHAPETAPPASSVLPDGVALGTSSYRRIVFALFLAGFSTFSLIYCVQPLLPDFEQHFRVSPAASSLPLSLTTGCLAFAIFVAAAVAESAGRRGLMFLSMFLAAVFNIAAAFSPGWTSLLAFRALAGLVLGGVPAVAMAYLAEEIDGRHLGRAMGVYVAGTAFGGMMGRVAMGFLIEAMPWREAMAVLGGLDLLAAIGFVLLLPPSRRFVRKRGFEPAYHLQAWRGHLARPEMLGLYASGFLVMGAFVAVYNYATFRLVGEPYRLTPTALSLVFSAYLFGIVASSMAGALADRLGRGPVLMAGVLIELLGVGLTLSSSLVGVIGGIVLLTIGFFIAHSVASGWVGRLAHGAKGHASSLYLLAYYLGSSIVGSSAGWFWSHSGWAGVCAFIGLVLTAAIGTALWLWKRAPPPQPARVSNVIDEPSA